MLPIAPRAGVGSVESRHVRSSWSLPFFAFFVSVSFILAPAIDPTAAFALSRDEVSLAVPGAAADDEMSLGVPGVLPDDDVQTVTSGDAVITIVRDQFGVTKLEVRAPVAAKPKPDPGSAKAIAYDMVLARGWDDAQYSCLVSLWDRESHWNVSAHNAKSGAHGIPQALPGSKMASVGADWETNPATQITWGLGYIAGRYTNPCGAWASSEAKGWY